MGIGGALATARSEAGLTVDQVSERTRIRRAIIRAIEQDDYSPCGGDYYVRGHIRAIARVVGTDPVPLVEEYDAAHGLRHAPHLEPGEADPALTITGVSRSRPTAPGGPRPGGITAAEAFRPVMPLQIQGARRPRVRAWVLLLVVLALVAILSYLLASQRPAPTRAGRPAAGVAHHRVPPAAVTSPAAASPGPVPTPLPVASAEVFGPGGPGQGDNPQGASFALDGNLGTAWHTDWYAQADLNGQPGTGLLLDLGTTMTVTRVQLVLGPAAGGTVQLRAGNFPSLAALPVVGQAALLGRAVTLQGRAPVPARYLLIWFTQLPPNGNGTYEAYVYNVSVSGTA